MSICPVPAKATKTDYTTPGSVTNTAPQPKFEMCEGGTTSVPTPGSTVTQTVCCSVPGPPGPPGLGGGSTLTLKDQGVVLGIIDSLDITGTTLVGSISGTAGTIEGSAMKWRGAWLAATLYYKNDVVLDVPTGDVYIATSNHSSSSANMPGISSMWDIVVDGAVISPLTKADQDWFSSMKNSVLDWVKNATVMDWLKLAVSGVGLIYAGAKIIGMMSGDGKGDGAADSRFHGTPGTQLSAYTATNLNALLTSIMHNYLGYATNEFVIFSNAINIPVQFMIGKQLSIRTLMDQLAQVYQFDIVSSGGIVKFVDKNITSVRTLTNLDLGHSQDTFGVQANYTAKRMQGIDLPRSITLSYISEAINYNTYTQQATLESYTAGSDIRIDVPFVLTDLQAKGIAEKILVNAHIEAQEISFTTDYFNVDLEPGDVITIPLDSGVTMDIRIRTITETNDGILEVHGCRADYNSSTYVVSSVLATPTPSQSSQSVVAVGYSQSLFIEVPNLNAEDTTPRLYAAVHGYNNQDWKGANIYQSIDGGGSYEYVMTATGIPTIGQVSGTPPIISRYQVWDTTSTITVVLKQGTLTTATDLAVLNGTNWCMIGQELIGFVNATLVATNTYQLSRLLRGRQGTEPLISTHEANELFVLIDDQLTVIPYSVNDLGKTTKYKTVSIGSDISKVTADDVQETALNLRPWRVANPKAVKQTNGDWLITWTERPQYNNSLRDWTEITHDANWSGFGVAILGSGSVVKNTYIGVDPVYTYTTAQQITDFGSIQSTISISILQTSKVTGSGYPYFLTA